MARISFSSVMDEIVGSLAGSTFQDSTFGLQMRTRVTPRNPQTQYSQLRRGEFGYISALWRTLTVAERNTYIAAAGTLPAALRLFITTNVNLTLVNVAILNSYVAAPVPTTLELSILQLDLMAFVVQAVGAVTTVPANTSLLILATDVREPTQLFTNPSMFTPIVSIPAGTDLLTPINIIADWNNRYGMLTANKRLCIKTVLISTLGGQRGAEIITCSQTSTMSNYTRLLTNTTLQGNAAGVNTIMFTLTIPAGAMPNVGDYLFIQSSYSTSAIASTTNINFFLGTFIGALGTGTGTLAQTWYAVLMRTDAATVIMKIYSVRGSNTRFDFPLVFEGWTNAQTKLMKAEVNFVTADKVLHQWTSVDRMLT